MGIFSKKQASKEKTINLLEELERLAELDNPLPAMKMMSKIDKRYSAWIGPNRPLHDRFISCIEKTKLKVDDRVYGRIPISDDDMDEIMQNLSKIKR